MGDDGVTRAEIYRKIFLYLVSVPSRRIWLISPQDKENSTNPKIPDTPKFSEPFHNFGAIKAVRLQFHRVISCHILPLFVNKPGAQ